MVHKIIIPREERRTKPNYLDLTLIELLDTNVKMNLPNLIIKHMQRVILKDDKNAHAIASGFLLAFIFRYYVVLV